MREESGAGTRRVFEELVSWVSVSFDTEIQPFVCSEKVTLVQRAFSKQKAAKLLTVMPRWFRGMTTMSSFVLSLEILEKYALMF